MKPSENKNIFQIFMKPSENKNIFQNLFGVLNKNKRKQNQPLGDKI